MLKEKIMSAKNYHRLFHVLVIIISNHRVGVKVDKDFRPRLIFKYEGGAVVNQKEIVIKYREYDEKIYCYDDFNRNERKESEIVEKVVEELLEKIDWNSVNVRQVVEDFMKTEIPELDSKDLFKILSDFCGNPFGNPLTSLFFQD